MTVLINDEKLIMDKISAISKRDRQSVRDVMLSLLMCMTIEMYGDNFELYIPYIAKLFVEVKKHDDLNVEILMRAEPSKAFIAELQAILNNENTPTEMYVKKQIGQKFHSLMNLKTLTEFIDEDENIV